MQTYTKKGARDEDENLFSALLVRYLPYWPLFLTLFVVSGVTAWLYLRYAIPVYETTATILVKDEKKGVDDQNLMEQLDLFGSKKFVENEIQVLQSKILMRDVVRKLSLYAPITSQGRINSISAYIYSPVTIQVSDPDSIITEKKVYFTYDPATKIVLVGKNKYPINTWFKDTLNNLLRFVPNINYQPPANEKPLYFSLTPVKIITESILKKMTVVQASKLSSVINMSYLDPVPKRGEDIIDSVIETYELAAIQDKNLLAYNTLRFINNRLGLVTFELDSVEKNIQKYKTDQGVVDISAQGQLYLDDVGANDQKLSEINVQLAVMDEIEKYVQSKGNDPGIVPSTFGVDDPVLAQLLGQLYGLEVQYAGLRNTTGENNPLLLTLQNEIDRMKPSILENIKNQRRNLEAGKANLTRTSDQYASVLRTIPKKERGLLNISRQQIVKNEIYSFLLQKREETALSYNSAVSDTRIVDNAEASVNPVSPKHMVVYAMAIIAALALGTGLIAMREVINPNIVFRKEIEQFTSFPVVGEIMQGDAENALVMSNEERNVISEQFRQLRTSLTYMGINSRKRKIMITSSVGGEGKSFVASNLALSLALMEKKVVLLELDLRKPKVSKIFNISREVGLTNYFVGDKEADHIIKSTEVNKNLFIIPSGPIPPNPSELILNGRLEDLLLYLETIFDYVIVDTAPVNPVTDAYIISNMIDATLYIVRHDVTPKNFIKRLDENSRVHALKNMAIVFNGVKNRVLSQYGYGYGYSYGYGYDDDKKKKGKKKTSVTK